MSSFQLKSSVGYGIAMLVSVAYFMLFASGTIGKSGVTWIGGSAAVAIAVWSGWLLGRWYRPVDGESPTFELLTCPMLVVLASVTGGILAMIGCAFAMGASEPNMWLAIVVTLYFGFMVFFSVAGLVVLVSFGVVGAWLAWRSRAQGDERIAIDRRTGVVKIGTLVLSPGTTPRDLPGNFELTPEFPMKVRRDVVPCRFARARVPDHDEVVAVELRFEQAVLVSCFFNVEAAGETPFRAHAEWLHNKLGILDGATTGFSWGSVGVATDKSGNVHTFVHNRNWRASA